MTRFSKFYGAATLLLLLTANISVWADDYSDVNVDSLNKEVQKSMDKMNPSPDVQQPVAAPAKRGGPRVDPATDLSNVDILTTPLKSGLQGTGDCDGQCKNQLLAVPVGDIVAITGPYATTNHVQSLIDSGTNLENLCPGSPSADADDYKATRDQVDGCKTKFCAKYPEGSGDYLGCQTSCPNNCNDLVWAMKAPPNNNCRSEFFVQKGPPKEKEGRIGPLSKIVIDKVSESIKDPNSGFLKVPEHDPLLMKLCPAFKDLDTDQRILFYAYLFENLAFNESRCEPNAPSIQGPTSRTAGMYQLEEPPSKRAWRGKACQVQNVHPVEANTACAVDGLESLIRHQDSIFGYMDRHSQWYALNTPQTCVHGRCHATSFGRHHPASKMRRDMCLFPACHGPNEDVKKYCDSLGSEIMGTQ